MKIFNLLGILFALIGILSLLGCATQSEVAKEQETWQARDQAEMGKIITVKQALLNKGYMTLDELNDSLLILQNRELNSVNLPPPQRWWGLNKQVQEAFDLFAFVIDKDLLPFKVNFYLAIEKENYDEAEFVRKNWINCLQYLKRFYESRNYWAQGLSTSSRIAFPETVARLSAQKIQMQLYKLEIVGLQDSILVTLRKELVLAIKEKKWDVAQKIQNLISARTKELTPLPPPQTQVVGSGAQTTVVIQQPDKIQVEQLHRYGVSDYGRVLSIIGGKPMSDKDAATLKLFDMLIER